MTKLLHSASGYNGRCSLEEWLNKWTIYDKGLYINRMASLHDAYSGLDCEENRKRYREFVEVHYQSHFFFGCGSHYFRPLFGPMGWAHGEFFRGNTQALLSVVGPIILGRFLDLWDGPTGKFLCLCIFSLQPGSPVQMAKR